MDKAGVPSSSSLTLVDVIVRVAEQRRTGRGTGWGLPWVSGGLLRPASSCARRFPSTLLQGAREKKPKTGEVEGAEVSPAHPVLPLVWDVWGGSMVSGARLAWGNQQGGSARWLGLCALASLA